MTLRRLPPLHAIRAFEAAARHLSMTRAADELSVTPGAVSRHVRALEERMETRLFIRRANGLALTSAGEALAGATRRALDEIADAASGVRLRRFRRLSVGAYGFFTSRLLLPRLAALRETEPELDIDLHTSSNPLDLTPSRYDAVIAVSDGAPRSGIVTHRLMPIATVPVCAPALLKAGPIDFAATPLLHARPRLDDWRRWLDHAGLGSIGATSGSSFESMGLAMEAAMAGIGVAIGIEGLLEEDVRSGRLLRAHPAIRPTRRFFVLEHEERLADDAALIAFADWLRRQSADACAPSS